MGFNSGFKGLNVPRASDTELNGGQVEGYFVMNMQKSKFDSSRVQISMGIVKSNFCD